MLPSFSPASPSYSALVTSLREAANLSDFLDAFEAALALCTEVDAYFINLHQTTDNTLLIERVKLPPALASLEQSYRNYNFAVVGDNPNVTALLQRKTVNISTDTIGSFIPTTRISFELLGAKYMRFVPLVSTVADTPALGTLVLISQKEDFSAELHDYCSQLIAEAAPLLRLHLKLDSWEKRALSIRDTEAELQSLLRFVAEMSNLTTNDEIHPRIQQEFLARFDLDLAAILLADNHSLRCLDTRFREQYATTWGKPWQAHCKQLVYTAEVTDGASSSVYLSNKPVFFGNMPSVRDVKMSTKDHDNLGLLPELQSFGILPIRKQGHPIGVLWLGSVRRLDALSTSQLVLAQHLCDFLGAVIENAHTYTLVNTQRREIESLVGTLQSRVEVLDQLASRDRLTGLYNFGSFEAELNKLLQISRAQHNPTPISVIMCDVDYFKRFNDTHGHVAGNAALQEVANRICRTVRGNEYVARYGGEEFAILIGRCSLEAAAGLARRVRENICKTPFVIDGVSHNVTISLGCSELRPGDDMAKFIARADAALYTAKQNGRNRVEVESAE